MNRAKFRVIEGLASVALGAIAVTVVLLFFPFEKPGDAATWAGALGTFLAFFAAIWLAMSQEIQRRREALDVAQLVAAQLTGRIEAIGNAASHIQARLAFAAASEKLHLDSVASLQILLNESGGDCITTEAMLKLIPLPNRAAHQLARSIGMMQSALAHMRQFGTKIGNKMQWEHLSERDQNGLGKKWLATLTDARHCLEVAYNQCRIAADVGAPPPKWDEVYTTDEENH